MEKIIFTELSGLVDGKVYPLVAPDKIIAPYIVYSNVATTSENTLDGGASIDLLRMQVDVYAGTYDQAKELAAQARSSLEGGTGRATLQAEIDLFEPDLSVFRVSQDFYFWKRG